ncbi:radical SAM protein [Atopobium fossor]|uniref:radical SAM protein n=1 Tax=Atopobium fossor TaxID=39487 RepID=UPI000412A4E1|nr:radical SAM protein [Atopobium fossor]
MHELQHITRKSMLYKTEVEYGNWAMNHVQGCSHGCLYPCYAYLMAKRFGRVSSYEQWCTPAIVDNTLELLAKELPKLAKKIDSVQLCFTTDPFMYGYDEICQMSVDAIRLINSFDVPCTALSKGVLPEELKSLSQKNAYGITLISLNEQYRQKTEPGAAPYVERIASLKKLHDNGQQTWVSIEPYPTPNLLEQDLGEILKTISFVDKIIFGRTHYNKVVSAYKQCREFYNEQSHKVIDFCQENDIAYHIKDGTLQE